MLTHPDSRLNPQEGREKADIQSQGMLEANSNQQAIPPVYEQQESSQQRYTQSPLPPYTYQPYGRYDVGPFELTSLGMRARTAAWLCYLFNWVTGIIFFLLERENRFVRFHAMQSILFFGTISILESISRYFEMLFIYGFGVAYFNVGGLTGAIGLISFVCWIVLMVQAGKGRYYKLPFFGNLAERAIGQFRF